MPKKPFIFVPSNFHRKETHMEFCGGGVPVVVAARIFGKDPQWVRIQMQRNLIDIGVCTKSETGQRHNYYISPKKLYDLTGYRWRGETYGQDIVTAK